MRRGAVSTGLLLLATLVAPACNKPDSVVVVKVTADADVPSVFQLRAFVSNAGDGETRVFPETAAAQPIVFDTSFSLTLPRARTGALDISLDGLAGGEAVANGTATVDLHAGDDVTVTITLHAGPSLCGNGVVDAGEGCDDGDRYSKGDCDYVCQPRTSGPGVGGTGGGGGTGTAGSGGAGGRPCMIDLLTSGDFDGNNARWTQVTSGRMLIYDQSATPAFAPAPHDGTHIAWLGYDVKSAKPAIRQNIMIPAGALQVNISGYYQVQTDESGCACDYARVQLDVGGNVTSLIEWSAYSANTDWAFFSTFVDGAPIAGQTVAFQIQADMDDGVNTSFYFDSLSVTANVCP
ncbi:MAG TPA: hypothetical protein VN903_37425 [Polyangia bacterium]|jgi:hypothetical protein|nr:hypothetical protein [Polyangia bacterium]